jgi:hypothetical protein
MYTSLKFDDELFVAQEMSKAITGKTYVAIGWLSGLTLELISAKEKSLKTLNQKELSISQLEQMINQSIKTPAKNSFTAVGLSKTDEYNIRITYFGNGTYYLKTSGYYDKSVEVILSYSINELHRKQQQNALKSNKPVNKKMLIKAIKAVNILRN